MYIQQPCQRHEYIVLDSDQGRVKLLACRFCLLTVNIAEIKALNMKHATVEREDAKSDT